MEPALHYLLKINILRKADKPENNSFVHQEIFTDTNPIKARQAAFAAYHEWVKDFLAAQDQEYTTDWDAREIMKFYVDSGTTSPITIGNRQYDYHDSIGLGVGVFMIVDEPIDDDEPGQELVLHGIGRISGADNVESLIFDLSKEYEYYRHFNYATDDFSTEVVFCNGSEWMEGYREGEPGTYTILKTPFDWTGYDKAYWWGPPEDDDGVPESEITLEEIIRNGETNKVEFKPALLFNFNTGRPGIGIKAIIARSICGFLNANGGLLLIGVADNGEVQGLEHDFKLADGKDPKDFFRLEFDQMVHHFLSSSANHFINRDFTTIDGKDVFYVDVSASKRRPIFLKGQNGKEFYLRAGASTRLLTDVEEIINYCLDRWGDGETSE